MEIYMSKYLKILLFSLVAFMGCEDTVESEGGLNILVNSVAEAAGDNCDNGGIKLMFGADLNADGTLSNDEVTNSSYVCNGTDGNGGIDETLNFSVVIIEDDSDMNAYYTPYENGSGGFLTYEYASELIDENVLNSGSIFVEFIPFGLENWYSIPFINYPAYSGGDYNINATYHYSLGKVYIRWDCNLPFDEDNWSDHVDYVVRPYKISIVTPS